MFPPPDTINQPPLCRVYTVFCLTLLANKQTNPELEEKFAHCDAPLVPGVVGKNESWLKPINIRILPNGVRASAFFPLREENLFQIQNPE